MAQILRTEKGGYSKKDVLKKMDAYGSLLFAIGNGMDSESAMTELENIKTMPLEREEEGFFARSGFSVEDSDAYFAEMEEKILNKINGEV